VDYLLRPPHDFVPKRKAAGIAIIVLQFTCLFPVLASWLRFIITVFANPGYVPLGEKANRRRSSHSRSKEGGEWSRKSMRRKIGLDKNPEDLDRMAVREGSAECPPGLERFYRKEVFTVGSDGVPRFCNHCWNWKPDRTHHCGELGRCVRLFDHYCPW
jgi:palmitoyltransferase